MIVDDRRLYLGLFILTFDVAFDMLHDPLHSRDQGLFIRFSSPLLQNGDDRSAARDKKSSYLSRASALLQRSTCILCIALANLSTMFLLHIYISL